MFFKRQPKGVDYLLFGLGNPGPRYAGTRHNVGWWLLDLLAEEHKASGRQSRHRSIAEFCEICGRQVALIKPTTFMNLSGESVRAWTREYPDTPFCVAYDDTALDVGKVRIREKGSAGGHNGMKSIIQCLGSDEFVRIRIGVGDSGDEDISDYVLADPPEADMPGLHNALRLAARCAGELVDGSIGRAQHLASGQDLQPKRERKPRVPKGPTRLTMADLIAVKLRGHTGQSELGRPAEDDADKPAGD